MPDTDVILNALDALRTDTQRTHGEIKSELRTGFRRVEDRLRDDHGRISRHSERFAALDRKRHGEVSGGYRDLRAKLAAKEPMSGWMKYLLIPAGGALAGMIATKGAPPLFALLAEVLK